MANTSELWDVNANPKGRIVRNEDIVTKKLAERVEHMTTTGYLLNAVELVPDRDFGFSQSIASALLTQGHPVFEVADELGYTHRIWPVTTASQQATILDTLRGTDLFVADGNHRTLASLKSGFSALFAVIMSPDTLRIYPHDRLVQDLCQSENELLQWLRTAGYTPRPASDLVSYPAKGEVKLLFQGKAWLVELPPSHGGLLENLDHHRADKMITETFGLRDEDPRVLYLGASYGTAFLGEQTQAGSTACGIAIAPVSMDEFIAVNQQRIRMPRKSTWFSPKVRSGVVVVKPQ
jgi:uncharacterized protein (DUF1015 family)